jgi:hypothetical protein
MRIWAALIVLLTACAPGKYSLIEENDLFTAFNSDSDYTQGATLEHENAERRIAIAQKIYTPTSKKLETPLSNERPYSGLLYAEREVFQPREGETQTSYTIVGGLVGPYALGEEAQCGVHKIIGQYCPYGWDSQLSTELVGTLKAKIAHRGSQELWLLSGLTQSTLEAGIGTLWTGVRSQTLVRWEAGPIYYYAGPALEIVLRDITLDGNTFESSPSVDKEVLVSELRAGVGAEWRGYGLEWFIAIRSPSFKTQGTSYNYGGIKISFAK